MEVSRRSFLKRGLLLGSAPMAAGLACRSDGDAFRQEDLQARRRQGNDQHLLLLLRRLRHDLLGPATANSSTLKATRTIR